MSEKTGQIERLRREIMHDMDGIIDYINTTYEVMDIVFELLQYIQEDLHATAGALGVSLTHRGEEISKLKEKLDKIKNKALYV